MIWSQMIWSQMIWSQMSNCHMRVTATHTQDWSSSVSMSDSDTMEVEATDWLVAVSLCWRFRNPRRILVTAAEVADAGGDVLQALVFSVVAGEIRRGGRWSRPLGLAARLEQVSFCEPTSCESVQQVVGTNHHAAINQPQSNSLSRFSGLTSLRCLSSLRT